MALQQQAVRRKSARIDQTLVYYDGPQLLTLVGSRNSRWICVGIPDQGDGCPMLCVQVGEDELNRYLSGHVDLRFLYRFRRGTDFRLADLSTENDGVLMLTAVEPKEDWFPKEGFFSRDHTEAPSGRMVRGGANGSPKIFTVYVDGEWEVPEFGVFGAKLSDCYSFLYAARALREEKPSIPVRGFEMALTVHPWRGGGSPLHFYDELYSRMPANDRLNVKSLQYASPGEIQVHGKGEIFEFILLAIRAMGANFHQAEEEYHAVHGFLSQQKLLTAPRNAIRGTSAQQTIVLGRVQRLSELIDFPDLTTLHKYSGENWILTAKIFMSYYRRLKILFLFYAEGRASQTR
jgi:hypothetical protein